MLEKISKWFGKQEIKLTVDFLIILILFYY